MFSSTQISVICLSRPYGTPHLGASSPSPLLSRPVFSISTSLPSCLSHMPSHATMTLPPKSPTTFILSACDNNNKSPDLLVVSTPKGDLLWSPTAKHSFPLLTTRPPPEPPPPHYEKLDKPDESITAATPSLLALIRPPPKPPWSVHGLLSLGPSDLISTVCLFSSLWFCFLWFKAALLLFDKKPHKGYVFWNKVAGVCWQSTVTKEAYEADSHCNNLFTHPPTIKHLENVGIVETNDSRNVRTQVKDIIRNWIGKKTVDSHSYIAKFRLWRTFLLTPFKLITVFLHEASHAIACLLTCGKVEGIQVHANEGGVTQTRGGIYWLILPAGYLGSSFWGMALILASTNILTARIAAGCFLAALVIVLFVAKNWTLRGLCIGFIVFIAVIWLLQEKTKVHILRYVILFIGVMNSLFSVYDIYDDLISRRVNSSDAEKFAEVCPCPCNGFGWGVIWGMISFAFLCASLYLGLVILS